MADKAGRKKCTIDFDLTKELDYANFGVETKTAEKKEDVGMNIGTFVVLVIVACIVGLAARKVWKDKKYVYSVFDGTLCPWVPFFLRFSLRKKVI